MDTTDRGQQMMRHNVRPGLAAFVASALGAALMVLAFNGTAEATTTPAASSSSSTACYPTDGDPTGERCSETRTDDGNVQWDAYDDTPPCVALVAGGAALGAGAAGTAAAATAGSIAHGTFWGAANGAFGCAYSS